MELIVLLVIGSAIWVFFDAPNHGESRTWALGFLLLWIVAFPWYLAVRSRRTKEPALPPAGWHPDPWGSGDLRWWDGQAWSGHRTPQQKRPPT